MIAPVVNRDCIVAFIRPQVLIGLQSIVAAGDAPLAIALQESAVLESSKAPLKIAVTDVFGKPVAGADAVVTVKTATRVSDSTPLFDEQKKLSANKDGAPSC